MRGTGPRTWRREIDQPAVIWVARGRAHYVDHTDAPCDVCGQLIDGPALVNNADDGAAIHLQMACPQIREWLLKDAGRER